MMALLRKLKTVLALVAVLLALKSRAAEPLSPAERQTLQQQAAELNKQAFGLYQAGKPADALSLARRVLEIRERLYPAADFPDGHPELVISLNSMDVLLQAMGEPSKALPYSEKALAITERLYPTAKYPDGHSNLALSLNNLGLLLQKMGDPSKALPYCQKALEMRQRLYPKLKFKDGHSELAQSLNNLGLIQHSLGESGKALPYFEQALAMQERLFPIAKYPAGHPELAQGLNNMGGLLQEMGENDKALRYYEQALAMNERLYPKDKYPAGHPNLATSLNNLGALLQGMGEYGKALLSFEKALAMREHLYPIAKYPAGHPDLAISLNNLGALLKDMGEYDKSLPYTEKALAMKERLYPIDRYKDGHPDLAASLSNLGLLLQEMGEHGKALPYCEKALAMYERLYPKDKYKDGHPLLAKSLSNLGFLLQVMGESGKALPYTEKALAMRQRLHLKDRNKDGHPELAASLNNLGLLLKARGESHKALPYFEQSLAMNERLYPRDRYKDGHPHLAKSLFNLSALLHALGKYRQALPYCEQSLAMNERLYPRDRYKDGHPELANSLGLLGVLLHSLGESGKALPYCEKALAMTERLFPKDRFKDGHPYLVINLTNLGFLLQAMGESGKALPYLKRSLEIDTRQARRETTAAPEAQALARLRSLPRTLDFYLDSSLNVPDEPAASIYERLWPTKGLLLELTTQRHQAALAAAAANPQTLKLWQRLVEVRRQLNHLAVEPGQDLAARDRRLVDLTQQQERLERDLARQLPTLARHRVLDSMGPNQLLNQLQPGTAFVDLVRHAYGKKGKLAGYRYQGFILAPGQSVGRVDLGPAQPIDEAITSWRQSIDRLEDSSTPRKLKELVWDKLAAQLPPGTKVVYLCPDGDLTRLPWAALPGTRAGSVLLEEVAIAVVPSGKWLLEQLLFPQKESAGRDTLVAAGAIDYGPAPSGTNAEYGRLAESGRELKRVLEAFGASEESGLSQGRATPALLKERLSKARYAHFATHGYFDQAGVSAERQYVQKQLEKWQFGLERETERVGVKQHPLGYVGLALAGANDPKSAADGGILTGLGIVDLPLEHLRLCVLSACETGLGDLTEGEGVIGLQRAFHVAGCPNVIGSLWKVNDSATAALMAQFYHELRVNKRSPLGALREAQLTIYRHPERIAALAGERGRPALEAAAKLGAAATVRSDEKAKKTPTKLWAAFVLSGVGTAK